MLFGEHARIRATPSGLLQPTVTNTPAADRPIACLAYHPATFSQRATAGVAQQDDDELRTMLRTLADR
jgi:hypothetical protein